MSEHHTPLDDLTPSERAKVRRYLARWDDPGPVTAQVDLDAFVERLTAVERQVGCLTMNVAIAGAVWSGMPKFPEISEARPVLYKLDDEARAALFAGAAEREARARELRAELEQLTAEQEAADEAACQAFPNSLAGDAALHASDLGPLRDAHRALRDVGEVGE